MSERPTPETDEEALLMDHYCDDTWATVYIKRGGWVVYGDFVLGDFARKLERERDEAREVIREIWQSGDAFLLHVDQETINRWRKATGWEETK